MGLSQRARVWTALLLPPLAWYSFQQGLSWTLRVNCAAAWIGIVWGAAAIALCITAAVIARRLVRKGAISVDPWLASFAPLGGLFFALAIGFQTLAITMVPPCAR